jgi:hypothetical protein
LKRKEKTWIELKADYCIDPIEIIVSFRKNFQKNEMDDYNEIITKRNRKRRYF